jgi:hypothetical protein
MLVHGEVDYIVPIHHSDKIFEGLAAKSSPKTGSYLEFRYGKSGLKRVSLDNLFTYYQISSAGHNDLHRYDLTAQAIVEFVSSVE